MANYWSAQSRTGQTNGYNLIHSRIGLIYSGEASIRGGIVSNMLTESNTTQSHANIPLDFSADCDPFGSHTSNQS